MRHAEDAPLSEDRLPVAEAEHLAQAVLEAAGLAAADARAVAVQLVAADRDGIASHGLARLPDAAAMVACGKINARAEPAISRPRPGLIHGRADDGYPHRLIELAAPLLAEAASKNGIAMLVVSQSYALNALGYFTERLAAGRFVVLGFSHAPASMAPAGGTRPVLGTNPLSIAVPRADGGCVIVDQSSSITAKSHVIDHRERGQPIPEGWAFDRDGRPTTSAAAALDGGSLAPFGGYKGFGVGLLVEVLSAALGGNSLGIEAPGLIDKSSGYPRVGASFIAIDPESVPGNGFAAGIERLAAAIEAQPGARLPGQRRLERRAASATHGIAIPRELHARLRRLAAG